MLTLPALDDAAAAGADAAETGVSHLFLPPRSLPSGQVRPTRTSARPLRSPCPRSALLSFHWTVTR